MTGRIVCILNCKFLNITLLYSLGRGQSTNKKPHAQAMHRPSAGTTISTVSERENDFDLSNSVEDNSLCCSSNNSMETSLTTLNSIPKSTTTLSLSEITVNSNNKKEPKPSTSTSILSTCSDTASTQAPVLSGNSQHSGIAIKEASLKRNTLIMRMVTFTFMLSYLPFLVLVTWRYADNNIPGKLSTKGKIVYNVFIKTYFLNSVIRPFIYFAMNDQYRFEMLKLIRRWFRCTWPCFITTYRRFIVFCFLFPVCIHIQFFTNTNVC